MESKDKYIKYKKKYLLLKEEINGGEIKKKLKKDILKEIVLNDDRPKDEVDLMDRSVVLDNRRDIIDWVEISSMTRESIVQIFSSIYIVEPQKPYIEPSDDLARGSGFIIHIDEERIIIMTNAHVVEFAKNILIRTENTGNIDINANIINICPEKDIALLEISKDEFDNFKKMPKKLDFADARIIPNASEVLCGGFPLGEENIKYTKGVLSGNQLVYNNFSERDMSFLQVDAAVNAGNSGGPLLNNEGKVIGINSAGIDAVGVQNVAFVIPTYIIISVIYELLHNKKKIIDIVDYNIKWNNINKSLFEKNDIYEKELGVLIYSDTVNNFLKLKKNDILFKLIIPDIFEGRLLNINYVLEMNNIKNYYENLEKLEVRIDNYGIINVYNSNNKEIEWTLNRKITLYELFDSIPVNIELEVFIIRERKEINYTCITTICEKCKYIKTLSPIYKPIEWEICLGCCFTPLNMDLIKLSHKDNDGHKDSEQINNQKAFYMYKFLLDEYRNKEWIAITNIFPEAEAHNLHIINYNEIDIIKKINDVEINSMGELKKVLLKFKNGYYDIEFEDGKKMVISDINHNSRKTDKKIYKKYNIIPTKFGKEWIKY